MSNQNEMEVFRTNGFAVVTVSDENGLGEVLHLLLRMGDKDIMIGDLLVKSGPLSREWYQCNEYAIAILKRDDIQPENNPIVKELFYIPTMAFVDGTPEQLKMLYHMMFDVTNEERTIDMEMATVTTGKVKKRENTHSLG